VGGRDSRKAGVVPYPLHRSVERKTTTTPTSLTAAAVAPSSWPFDALLDANTNARAFRSVHLSAKFANQTQLPAPQCIDNDNFQDRRIRPLCHPSGWRIANKHRAFRAMRAFSNACLMPNLMPAPVQLGAALCNISLVCPLEHSSGH